VSAGYRYDPVHAERILGRAVMEAADREAAEAPPMTAEVREQLRALFASARINRPATKAA
jgi:hypothetical protein